MSKVTGSLGELFVTAGVLMLLFVVYTLWGTGIQTAAAQNELRDQLDFGQAAESSPTSTDESTPSQVDNIEIGEAYGLIRIPRFGDEWEWNIVQGVEEEDLKKGPGHYPDSANPGETGNFAIAGHRSGHGEPLANFPELRVGDIIEVETVDGVFTYQLDDAPDGDPDGNKIGIMDNWVVDPVPGKSASTEPTEQRITITTCWPRYGSSHRMYATGTLVSAAQR